SNRDPECAVPWPSEGQRLDNPVVYLHRPRGRPRRAVRGGGGSARHHDRHVRARPAPCGPGGPRRRSRRLRENSCPEGNGQDSWLKLRPDGYNRRRGMFTILREKNTMPIHNWARVEANLFHHFHQAWTMTISNVLNGGLLPNGFSALVEQHAGGLVPDVIAL